MKRLLYVLIGLALASFIWWADWGDLNVVLVFIATFSLGWLLSRRLKDQISFSVAVSSLVAIAWFMYQESFSPEVLAGLLVASWIPIGFLVGKVFGFISGKFSYDWQSKARAMKGSVTIKPIRLPRLSKRVAGIASLVLVAIAGFYWYEIRPSQIRAECSEYAHAAAYGYTDERGYGRYDGDAYDARYELCLNSHGL